MNTRTPPCILRLLGCLLLGSIFWAAPAEVHAAEGSRFLVGLPVTDSATGTAYAYLRWRAEDPGQLRNRSMSIHAKAGTATSAAPFFAVGRLQAISQPAILNALANTFPGALFDQERVSAQLDTMFGDFLLASHIPFADRVSTIVQIASADPDIWSRLLMLAYAEPFIAVAMGVAAVVPMSTPVVTFELREAAARGGAIDPDTENFVTGRVTVDTNAPPPLPRPPAPIAIQDLGPTGHLNAQLRWNSTVGIARATPVLFGFNLYRMNRTYAEANGWHNTFIPAATLQQLLVSSPDVFQQVNLAAILPDGNPDPNVPFFIDDRKVLDVADKRFADGDSFYYFLANRDLLGRISSSSLGTLVTICARLPSEAARRVEVRNRRQFDAATGTATMRLEVSWRPHEDADASGVVGYEVYRWESVNEMQTTEPSAAATRRVSGLIPHVPGQLHYTWRDESLNAPDESAVGITAWYSVRAIIQTSCGLLASGDSAPGAGAIRDFSGPAITDDYSLVASQLSPVIVFLDPPDPQMFPELQDGFEGPKGNVGYLSVRVLRANPAITGFQMGFARPRANGGVDYQTIASFTFGPEEEFYVNRRIPRDWYLPENNVRIWMRAQASNGSKTFYHAALSNLMIDNNIIKTIQATLAISSEEQIFGPNSSLPDGFVHSPVITGTDSLNPVDLFFRIPPGAREYKLYKRIDDGPLIFMAQSTQLSAPGTVAAVQDSHFPPYGGTICYFIQWFDQHGNPSPLAPIGCIEVGTKADLPVPLLETPQAVGSEASPAVLLSWFCPPDGVERFRIYIGGGLTPVELAQPGLRRGAISLKSIPIASIPSIPLAPSPNELRGDVVYEVFETGRVGANFGNPFESGRFEQTLNVVAGRTYHFYVEALSASGDASRPSAIESFMWTAPSTIDPDLVPWPARSLPPLDTNFIPQLAALVLDFPNRFEGVGIRIGTFTTVSDSFIPGGPVVADNIVFLEPTRWADNTASSALLFTSAGGEPVFPCVVYRYMVDEQTGAPVTGDLAQVTPLLEGLMDVVVNGEIQLFNPYVDIFPEGNFYSIFIKDTQPVIFGESYRYLIARFGPDGEVDRIIPLPPVKVDR